MTPRATLFLQEPGSLVTGGTINFEGPLEVRATATGGRSTLAGVGVDVNVGVSVGVDLDVGVLEILEVSTASPSVQRLWRYRVVGAGRWDHKCTYDVEGSEL